MKASPRDVPLPDLWMLGSTDQGAAFAAYFGLAFSFAHFISERGRPEVMNYYRSEFRPSGLLEMPAASVAASHQIRRSMYDPVKMSLRSAFPSGARSPAAPGGFEDRSRHQRHFVVTISD